VCIGIPMQAIQTAPGRARVAGRGEVRDVDTTLIGEVEAGEWVLVFLDGARERLDPQRAQEMNETLDLVEAALAGRSAREPHFTLPSEMDAAQLAALTGGTS